MKHRSLIAVAGVIDELAPDTELVLLHGTDASDAKKFLRHGIDGTREVGRMHNQGRERGLYVTPSLKCARAFGSVVFKLKLKAKSLYPTARWCFGVGRKTVSVKELASEQFPNSFRPVVSLQLRERIEPQAMYLGFVPVRDIVAVYVFNPRNRQFEKLSVPEARKRFGAGAGKREWSGNETADEVLARIGSEHDIEHDELLDLLGRDTDETEATLDSMGLPRKLIRRVTQYIKSQAQTQTHATEDEKETQMSNAALKAIASELRSTGVRCHVVTAAEAKDTENPPYSRKRSITSLNDKRLLKVLSILDKCSGIAGTKTLRKKIKSYDVKEAGDFLVHMQAMCDSWNERMRDIFDIVKSLSGKDGINISGCYSAGSSNARLAIQHGDYKTDPVGTCDSVLTAIERAMRHVQAARTRVVKEALKRGIVDTKIDVLNKHLFQ